MFLDEELPRKKKDSFEPRNLEPLSVAELEQYIADLNGEIARAQAEITRKKTAAAAADSFFKK